jgi:hypothetical protein
VDARRSTARFGRDSTIVDQYDDVLHRVTETTTNEITT